MLTLVSGLNLILASGSPRRKELLESTGLDFKILVPGIEEVKSDSESASEMVSRLARSKALHVAHQYPSAVVVGADTTVVIGTQVLEKPRDSADAERMLGIIQGKSHTVWSAFCVVCKEKEIEVVEAYASSVRMQSMSRDLIAKYVASGEPLDKAGAYAIQGIGAHLVAEISGSYTNVVGLNVAALIECMWRNKLLSLA